MSLVGTRPPTVDEWDKYELHHRARLATKPGLTGMWQVSGQSNITDFKAVHEYLVNGGKRYRFIPAKVEVEQYESIVTENSMENYKSEFVSE